MEDVGKIETDPRIINERIEKMAAMDGQTQAMAGNLCGAAEIGPCRPSMIDRVGEQRRQAQRDRHRGERLEELEYLLNKYPYIARILDLLEDVRG
jgi:hypothetical protein